MLGMALVMGVMAVVLARNWLAQNLQPVVVKEEKLPTKTLVVARSQLTFGNRIGPEHVREIPWAADRMPEGSFQTVEALFPSEEPRVVLREIQANEPILASKVSGEGGRATLSAVIAEDMRAVTIRVNDVLGVAGFVLPGDRVDVLLTREVQKNNPITDVLLQNVNVLGIDQEASEDKDKPKVARAVTLEVSSHQAQKLTLAAEVGTLSLALRNRLNAGADPARTVTVRDLKVGEANETEKVATPAPKPKTVVKRVVKRETNRFASVKVVRGLKPSQYDVVEESEAPRALHRPVPLLAPSAWSAPTSPASDEDTSAPIPLVPEAEAPDVGEESPAAPENVPVSLLPEDVR